MRTKPTLWEFPQGNSHLKRSGMQVISLRGINKDSGVTCGVHDET